MAERPTWALIDDAVQAAGVVEGLANTIATRRDGPDERLARLAAGYAKKCSDLLGRVEREDDSDG